MEIPLDRFEEIIDDNILRRGLDYFQSRAIKDFSELSYGCYEAFISGTELYKAQLEIRNNTIIHFNCDCPYDLGPVCKHIVAVIFYLKQDELELSATTPKTTKAKKAQPINQQVKRLLDTISHEDLVKFVIENSKKDKKFRNCLLATFSHLNPNQSKAFYQSQIHSILKTAKGRDGWLDWAGMRDVVNATKPFLDNAEKYLEKNSFENVFFIGAALLEEMTAALQYSDDSNGDIGNYIDSAMNLFSR